MLEHLSKVFKAWAERGWAALWQLESETALEFSSDRRLIDARDGANSRSRVVNCLPGLREWPRGTSCRWVNFHELATASKRPRKIEVDRSRIHAGANKPFKLAKLLTEPLDRRSAGSHFAALTIQCQEMPLASPPPLC